VIIRTFQSGDEVAFHNLNEFWILESFTMDDKDRLILGDPIGRVLKAGGEIFIVERADATLGCCALLPLENQSWELAKMAVAKEHRGCGIGRRLLNHVVEYAKQRGAHKLCLKTSSLLQPAIHLYKSAGFQIVAEVNSRLSRNARADVFMELILQQT
jgi:ribosomal protein S18 acetylase RimI-like enzyme